MKQGVILYEPLPIARLGIRASDQEVIMANDYSCFAQMLEEYISHGVVKIAIPTSSPEVKIIDQMPLLLKSRVVLVDDSSEREALHRLFHNFVKSLILLLMMNKIIYLFLKNLIGIYLLV